MGRAGGGETAEGRRAERLFREGLQVFEELGAELEFARTARIFADYLCIAPEGTVFVRGELWRARSPMSIAAGEGVRVTDINGLTLNVEAEKDDAIAPKKASAVDG